LRATADWPNSCDTTDKRDERAPPHFAAPGSQMQKLFQVSTAAHRTSLRHKELCVSYRRTRLCVGTR
jgi:hypothetical protein